MIIYTSCMASDDVMNLAIDLKSGVVTVPEDGFYEISLTGAMKTFAGKRIWVTLNKKTGETDGTVNNQSTHYDNFSKAKSLS